MKRILVGLIAAVAFLVFVGAPQASKDNYTVKVLAGSPGYDHIQPFMAELYGYWKKYGVKVNFISGNYMRANQMMSIGDFDVGYNQYATAIRYNAAGIPNVIVGSSSANCALLVANKNIKSWADLKGKRIGIVTKFDVQYLTLIKHILPRFGLTADDVQLTRVPVPETATGIITGSVAAAFPFEPFGTSALSRGGRLLLAAEDMIDKSVLNTDMLRNGLVMHKKFLREHPDLAKRIVWAHMDAVEMMRTDKSKGIATIRHYNPKIDVKLITDAYDNCGWQYQRPPRIWIETLIRWMTEEKVLKKKVTYDEVVDFSLQDGYPGYPGWNKLK